MFEYIKEIKDEMNEIGFKLIDAILSVITALAFCVSLAIMKFCANTFNIKPITSVLCGIIPFFIALNIIVYIGQKAHKDDFIDEEDEEDED